MDFGSRLAAWLVIRGMKKSTLASKVGVSRAAVTAWLKGQPPTGRNIEAVFAALGVTATEFFGGPQTKEAA